MRSFLSQLLFITCLLTFLTTPGNSFAAIVDCGLRIYDESGGFGPTTNTIACEDPPVSRLRIHKNGVTYGVALTDPGSISTRFNIQTPEGVKALVTLTWQWSESFTCYVEPLPYPYCYSLSGNPLTSPQGYA